MLFFVWQCDDLLTEKVTISKIIIFKRLYEYGNFTDWLAIRRNIFETCRMKKINQHLKM